MSGVNCTSVAYVCVFVCLCAYVWGGGVAGRGPEANVPNARWREVNNH